MITISLCMIVKNEEEVLARCLETVADLVEEIIIVDTGSTDLSMDLSRRFDAKIFSYTWIDDFSAARNFSFEQATQEYILWLDADDVIWEEDRRKLKVLKEELDTFPDSITMLYHLSRDSYGNPTLSIRRNRLVRRTAGFRWIGAVHEYLEVGGAIIHSEIAVQHLGKISGSMDPLRNLKIYEKQLESGKNFTPRDLYYYANELKDHGMLNRAISNYEAFLTDGRGWIEDNIAACGKLADCYHELGKPSAELGASLRSLEYDAPRPEFCCRIGYYFLNQGNYRAAVVWYQLALTTLFPEHSLGFNNIACSTWLPHLQLSVCYDKLGQYELAHQHNEWALEYQPENETMLANRRYFLERLERIIKSLEEITESNEVSHE